MENNKSKFKKIFLLSLIFSQNFCLFIGLTNKNKFFSTTDLITKDFYSSSPSLAISQPSLSKTLNLPWLEKYENDKDFVNQNFNGYKYGNLISKALFARYIGLIICAFKKFQKHILNNYKNLKFAYYDWGMFYRSRRIIEFNQKYFDQLLEKIEWEDLFDFDTYELNYKGGYGGGWRGYWGKEIIYYFLSDEPDGIYYVDEKDKENENNEINRKIKDEIKNIKKGKDANVDNADNARKKLLTFNDTITTQISATKTLSYNEELIKYLGQIVNEMRTNINDEVLLPQNENINFDKITSLTEWRQDYEDIKQFHSWIQNEENFTDIVKARIQHAKFTDIVNKDELILKNELHLVLSVNNYRNFYKFLKLNNKKNEHGEIINFEDMIKRFYYLTRKNQSILIFEKAVASYIFATKNNKVIDNFDFDEMVVRYWDYIMWTIVGLEISLLCHYISPLFYETRSMYLANNSWEYPPTSAQIDIANTYRNFNSGFTHPTEVIGTLTRMSNISKNYVSIDSANKLLTYTATAGMLGAVKKVFKQKINVMGERLETNLKTLLYDDGNIITNQERVTIGTNNQNNIPNRDMREIDNIITNHEESINEENFGRNETTNDEQETRNRIQQLYNEISSFICWLPSWHQAHTRIITNNWSDLQQSYSRINDLNGEELHSLLNRFTNFHSQLSQLWKFKDWKKQQDIEKKRKNKKEELKDSQNNRNNTLSNIDIDTSSFFESHPLPNITNNIVTHNIDDNTRALYNTPLVDVNDMLQREEHRKNNREISQRVSQLSTYGTRLTPKKIKIESLIRPIIGERRIRCYWRHNQYWIRIADLPDELQLKIFESYSNKLGEQDRIKQKIAQKKAIPFSLLQRVRYIPISQLIDLTLTQFYNKYNCETLSINNSELIDVIAINYLRLLHEDKVIIKPKPKLQTIDDNLINSEYYRDDYDETLSDTIDFNNNDPIYSSNVPGKTCFNNSNKEKERIRKIIDVLVRENMLSSSTFITFNIGENGKLALVINYDKLKQEMKERFNACTDKYFSDDDLYNLCYGSVITWQPKSQYANESIVPVFSSSFLEIFNDESDVDSNIKNTNKLIYFLLNFMLETKSEIDFSNKESIKKFENWVRENENASLEELNSYFENMSDEVIKSSKQLLQKIPKKIGENLCNNIIQQRSVFTSIELTRTIETSNNLSTTTKETYSVVDVGKGQRMICHDHRVTDNYGDTKLTSLMDDDNFFDDSKKDQHFQLLLKSMNESSTLINDKGILLLNDGRTEQKTSFLQLPDGSKVKVSQSHENNINSLISNKNEINHKWKFQLQKKRANVKKPQSNLSGNEMSNTISQRVIKDNNQLNRINMQTNNSDNNSLISMNNMKNLDMAIKPGKSLKLENYMEIGDKRQTTKIVFQKNANNNNSNIQKPVPKQTKKEITDKEIKQSIELLFLLIDFMVEKNRNDFKLVYEEQYFYEWLLHKERNFKGYTNRIKKYFNLNKIEDFSFNLVPKGILKLPNEFFKKVIKPTLIKVLKKNLQNIFSATKICITNKYNNKYNNKSRWVFIKSLPETIINMIMNRKHVVRDLDCVPWEYIEQIIIDEIILNNFRIVKKKGKKNRFSLFTDCELKQIFHLCFVEFDKEIIDDKQLSNNVIANNEIKITDNDMRKLIEKIILNDLSNSKKPDIIKVIARDLPSIVEINIKINIVNLRKKIYEEIFGLREIFSFFQMLKNYQNSNEFQKKLFNFLSGNTDNGLASDCKKILVELCKEGKLDKKLEAWVINALCRDEGINLVIIEQPDWHMKNANSISGFVYRKIDKIFKNLYDGKKLLNSRYYDSSVAIYLDSRRQWVNYIIDVKSLKNEIIESFASLDEGVLNEKELYLICKHAILHNMWCYLNNIWDHKYTGFDFTMYYYDQLSKNNTNLLTNNNGEFGIKTKTIMNRNIWNFYDNIDKTIIEILFRNRKCMPLKIIDKKIFYQLNINEIQRILLEKFAGNSDIIMLLIKKNSIKILNSIIRYVFKKFKKQWLYIYFEDDPNFINLDTMMVMNFSSETFRRSTCIRSNVINLKSNLGEIFRFGNKLNEARKRELLTRYSSIVEEIKSCLISLIKEKNAIKGDDDYETKTYSNKIQFLYAEALDIQLQCRFNVTLEYIGNVRGNCYEKDTRVFNDAPNVTLFKFFGLPDKQ